MRGAQGRHPAWSIRAVCLEGMPSHRSPEDCTGLESPRRDGNGIVSRGNTKGKDRTLQGRSDSPGRCRCNLEGHESWM